MDFLKEIKSRVLIHDGSKGYMLQKMGLKGGECPELWNVTHSDAVSDIYSLYKKAGSDVIQTNSFQGNRIKLAEYSLEDRVYELNYEAARLAREVMGKNGFVTGSIGPLGILFEPSGKLTFEKAYDTFKEQMKGLVDGGVDVINLETFTDVAEIRAALLAAKENFNLPVICSVSFLENGKTLMGSDPYTVAVILKSLGADMIGTNCSSEVTKMVDLARIMYEATGIPVSVKPNAGIPEVVNGEVRYNITPSEFAKISKEFVKYGARLIGGCCGTTPEHVQSIRVEIDGIEVPKLCSKGEHVITSSVKSVIIENDGLKIAEINSFKDEELYSSLNAGNVDCVLDRALDLTDGGFDAVLVNLGNISSQEVLLAEAVNTIQSYVKEPVLIETTNSAALEKALRIYKGKAGVVVSSSDDSIEEILRTSAKYGSTIVEAGMLKYI